MTDSVVFDDQRYYKLSDEVWTSDAYAIRIQVGRDLSEDEASQLADLVAYAYAKTGGERNNGFTQDSPRSIIYWADTTKGRASRHLDRFFDDVRTFVVEGSPQRKTMNNTRAVEGLGDVGEVTFWADNVYPPQPEVPDGCNVINGIVTRADAAAYDDACDERGFDSDGVHRNGTLLDEAGCDVTGEKFNPAGDIALDPDEDRVSRTSDNEVVKFKFRGGTPVSVQKLVTAQDGTMKWGTPRTTSTSSGLSTLRKVTGLNPAARAVPASVASRYGTATQTCMLCGRALSSTESRNAGYGPECRSKLYAS